MTFAPHTIQGNERLSVAVARVHKVQSSLALDLVQRSKMLPKGAATFRADCLAQPQISCHSCRPARRRSVRIAPGPMRRAFERGAWISGRSEEAEHRHDHG